MIGTLIIGMLIGMMVESLAIIGIVVYFAKGNKNEEVYKDISDSTEDHDGDIQTTMRYGDI